MELRRGRTLSPANEAQMRQDYRVQTFRGFGRTNHRAFRDDVVIAFLRFFNYTNIHIQSASCMQSD